MIPPARKMPSQGHEPARPFRPSTDTITRPIRDGGASTSLSSSLVSAISSTWLSATKNSTIVVFLLLL